MQVFITVSYPKEERRMRLSGEARSGQADDPATTSTHSAWLAPTRASPQ
jgi:hypothetical protein